MANNLFDNIGLHIQDLVSGFAGGTVNALFFQRSQPAAAVASVLGGALTANYMAVAAAHLTGTDEGVAGFIVGVTAMAICQGLFSVVQSWIARFKANKADV